MTVKPPRGLGSCRYDDVAIVFSVFFYSVLVDVDTALVGLSLCVSNWDDYLWI